MEILEGDSVEVVKITAYVRVGKEEWAGVAFWTMPRQPAGWQQLIVNATGAFGQSLEQTAGLDKVKRFRLDGCRMALKGPSARLFLDKDDKLPNNSPERVQWGPIQTLRFRAVEDN